jgi:hypothetical protein
MGSQGSWGCRLARSWATQQLLLLLLGSRLVLASLLLLLPPPPLPAMPVGVMLVVSTMTLRQTLPVLRVMQGLVWGSVALRQVLLLLPLSLGLCMHLTAQPHSSSSSSRW